MSSGALPDDEIVYRRIPPKSPWFQPPDQISSANFKLDKRRREQGVSVYRAALLSPDEVLRKAGAIPGSFIVEATIGEIRKLQSGAGEPLNLDVVMDNEDDPPHAEIRGPTPGHLSASASEQLKRLFPALSR